MRRGFSMIEAVVAMAVASVLLTGTLALVPLMVRGDILVADRVRGEHLAMELLDETWGVGFEGSGVRLSGSSVLAVSALGVEVRALEAGAAEKVGVTRSSFGDLDAYDGWSASPPERADGEAMPGFAGWRREVEVVDIDPETFAASGVATGVKRVTVRAWRGGALMAEVSAIRTDAVGGGS